MSRPLTLIVTCEHGGNQIPSPYRHLFQTAHDQLTSHRGWDPGALELATRITRALMGPLFSAEISRLFVELNRSVGHPSLFSDWMKSVPEEERQQILETWYYPYRRQVTAAIASEVQSGARVLHLSVHSFTPVLGGDVRNADIGLLYDPRRNGERQFCHHWQKAMRLSQPTWRVRRNYPYRGASDGFTTSLRRQFPDDSYLGIELEVNQGWVQNAAVDWPVRQEEILATLVSAMSSAIESSLFTTVDSD